MDQATIQQIRFNETATGFRYKGVVARWIEASDRRPDSPAVIFNDTVLSHAQFRGRVDALAARLRAMGAGPEAKVALLLDRSIEMVVAIWATLRAGAAYVPLATDLPPARLDSLLAELRPVAVLTQAGRRDRLPADLPVPVLALDAREAAGDGAAGMEPPLPAAHDLAYVIYTSGSTGQPKGVMIEHGALDNRIHWMQRCYGLAPDHRVMQKTPYTFDVSVWEFLWPLAQGATLVVAQPNGHMAPKYLARLIQERQVTHIHFVPSMLRLFLRLGSTVAGLPLRQVFCSGEALPADLVGQFLAHSPAELHNLYGPTEAAIDVTAWRCGPAEASGTVPIGRPIDNVALFVLDEAMRPVPAGTTGELFIGGIALARGYLNRPDQTAERFVPAPPWLPGGPRLYRTGDLARFRPDGAIEYLGRNDDQVKVNGIRVELGEIETLLKRQPGVADAVVALAGPAESRQLAAFLVAGTEGLDTERVMAGLRQSLPEALVPRHVRQVAERPVTANGKTDRAALCALLESPAQTL